MKRTKSIAAIAGTVLLGAVAFGIIRNVRLREDYEVKSAQMLDGSGEDGQEAIFRQSGAATVCVRVGGISGSGVICFVDEKTIYIVTAAHVLTDGGEGQTVTVSCGVSPEAVCRAAWIAAGADLAFLEIERETLPGDFAKVCRRVVTDKEKFDGLTSGDPVFCMGYSGNGELSCYSGILTDNWIYVEDFAQYMILADCEIYPGMSGGGLYDRWGCLIGIACGGNEQGELAAVPLHVVQAKFAERYG